MSQFIKALAGMLLECARHFYLDLNTFPKSPSGKEL